MDAQGHSKARILLTTGAAAALLMAVACALFPILYAPLPARNVLVTLLLAVLLTTAAGGLALGKKWAAVLGCGAGAGFAVATLDITVFGYRSVGPAKYLVFLPALYLAAVPALPEVRIRFGFRPLSPRTATILLALAVALPPLSLGGYLALINARVDPATTRLRSEPLDSLTVSIAGDDRRYLWSDRYNGLVPADGDILKREDRTISVKTGPGEVVNLDRAPIFWDVDYAFFGYGSIYEFEKAVWNAGYGQPALLMIKDRLAWPGARVYHADGSRVRAVVSVHFNQGKEQWVARASIYQDGDLGVTYLSMSPIRGRALSPVMKTIAYEGKSGDANEREERSTP